MQGYNCIMVFNKDCSKLLFCKRTRDPYKGLYNLVGGKIEKGEDGFDAAYRELQEETGLGPSQIELRHMMDFTYYNQNCYVEVYAGILNSDAVLIEEEHPLVWLDLNENFFDCSKFAGEGNIGHMVEQARQFGMGVARASGEVEDKKRQVDPSLTSIGVDGCAGGWLLAALKQGKLSLKKYGSVNDIVRDYPDFDGFLIDMVIGLPGNKEQIRPDGFARKIIKERASTIFPAPCRQAIYATSKAEAYRQNEIILGKKFTPLTLGIMPKMYQLDSFLQANPQYKNLIKESHPELCFARLNGKTVLSRKTEFEGIMDRIKILSKYLPELDFSEISSYAVRLKCEIDDILDAICLCVTANLASQGYYEVIPENPMYDDTGLLMQMIIPKLD